MKFKKGDTVIVTAGKDRGKKGKVEKVLLKEKRVLVAGVNIYKRHMKKRDEKNPGGIVETERPLPVANIAIICPSCKRQTRIGTNVEKNGKKERMCRKCEAKL